MNQAAQKCARRQNHTRGAVSKAGVIFNAHHGIVFDHQPFHHGLLQIQIRLAFNSGFHQCVIPAFIVLGSGRVNRWPFFGIQRPVLDGGLIGDSGHFSAERIDFLDQLTLGHSTDGRAARHGGNLIEIDRQKKHRTTHPCCRQSRFTSGMSGSDHDDVIMFCIENHW